LFIFVCPYEVNRAWKNIAEIPKKMDNAIEATGLTKYYGDFPAVDHISFEVKKGEIFGFLGPNGEGKRRSA